MISSRGGRYVCLAGKYSADGFELINCTLYDSRRGVVK